MWKKRSRMAPKFWTTMIWRRMVLTSTEMPWLSSRIARGHCDWIFHVIKDRVHPSSSSLLFPWPLVFLCNVRLCLCYEGKFLFESFNQVNNTYWASTVCQALSEALHPYTWLSLCLFLCMFKQWVQSWWILKILPSVFYLINLCQLVCLVTSKAQAKTSLADQTPIFSVIA